MEKSFRFLVILLVMLFIGSLNMVYASNDNSTEVVLDYSSLSSDSLEDIVSVNDNVVYVSDFGNDEFGKGTIDSPYASLSQAIDKSKNGDSIYLNGSFSGAKNSNLVIDKNLSITSFGLSYIQGDSKNRMFYVLEGCVLSVSNLSFSSFDVSNLNDSNGGAIYSEGSLIINNCEFNSCVANNGGSIYSKGKIIVNDSKFYNNRAFAYGGAIYCLSDNSLFNNSIFKDNHAKSKSSKVSGGAISNYGDNCTVSNSVFDGNYAKETSKIKNDPIYGGAISNYGNGFYIYNCDFTSNYVEIRTDAGANENCLNTAEGGAIYTVANSKIENCRFDNDTAHCKYSSNQVNLYGNKCYGGAIFICQGNGFYLLNNTFINCSSAMGVVNNNADNALFENNTFNNGKAMFTGSAIDDSGENNIYRGNVFFNNNDYKNHAQGTVYVAAHNVTFENNSFISNYDTSNSVHSSNNAAIYIYNPSFNGGSDAEDTNIKISNNNFDGNDRGIYLYCAAGAEISNNKFTNQKYNAINAYVGRDLNILNNYFENNHGYYGAVDINSRNTLIKGNTFVNNSGIAGGSIGVLCRENISIDSNNFIDNHAAKGGGDIYSIYGDMLVTNNNFVSNSISGNDVSIFTESSGINLLNNKFTIYNNQHKIIEQKGQAEFYLNNIIYDNTPVNKDGSINSSSVENLVDLHKRTDNDFTYYRNATENNADLTDDESTDDNQNSTDNNHNSTDNPIKDIIDKVIDDVKDIIDEISESGDGNSNGSSISGENGFNGYDTNSSSGIGNSHEISPKSTVGPVGALSSGAVSHSIAYELSGKKLDQSYNVIKFILLFVILAILLIYGYYRGRNS